MKLSSKLQSVLFVVLSFCVSAQSFAKMHRLNDQLNWSEDHQVAAKTAGESVVLFVHGAYVEDQDGLYVVSEKDSLEKMKGLAKKVHGLNLFSHVVAYSYDSTGEISSIANDLAAQVRSLMAKRIILIAHSKGGVVSRWVLENNKDINNVPQAIFLATPHMQFELPFFAKMALAATKGSVLKEEVVGLIEEFTDLSDVYASLNQSKPAAPATAYHIIQGNIEDKVDEVPVSEYLVEMIYGAGKTDGVIPFYTETELKQYFSGKKNLFTKLYFGQNHMSLVRDNEVYQYISSVIRDN